MKSLENKKYYPEIESSVSFPEIEEKILIDCSNGAYSCNLQEHLSFLDNIEYKSTKPNGNNINLKCGALEPNLLLESVIKDGYDKFLKKMYDRLTEVSSELSEKNPATTNEESRYEIKREKNLEFKINNTPIREVLGKF